MTPHTNIDYACLLAANSSIAQTQAHDAAVEKRIVALESQVLQLTSTLHDVRTKTRQGYDRLKIRVDLLEQLLIRGARSTRSPPRSASPRTGGVTHQLIVSHRPRPINGTFFRRMVVDVVTHVGPMRIRDLLWIYISL